jgi:sigma-E factor negative regulatory protein RseA
MKDTLNEQLSALVDDELDTGEAALLLRQMGKDETLRNRFARYQLVSDALKNNIPAQVDPGFHQRVQAALQDEAAPQGVPAGMQFGRLVRPFAGVAVAASVAVVAVLSLQSVRETTSQSTPVIAAVPAAADYIRAEGQAPVARSSNRDLEAYLVNHNEFAVNRGMLPYVRIVGQGEQGSGQKDVK